MAAEIVAKLGLSDAKFAAGLTSAEGKFNQWSRRLRTKTADILPSGGGSVDVALRGAQRAAERAAETVKNKLRLARQPEVAQLTDSSVDIALRAAAQGAKNKPPIPLVPSPEEAEKKAGGIIGLLQKKFGSTDLFKDSLKGIGLGLGVGALAERVVNVFRHGASEAKQMADHSEAMVDIQRQLLGAMGGPRRELELQVKQVNELNRDIAAQKTLVESLTNLPLQFLSPDHQQQLDEAKAGLNALLEKQASLSAGAKIAAHEENLRTDALKRAGEHATNLANIELRHGVEAMKFDERRRALQEEYAALQKQGALPGVLQENINRQKALEKERQIFFRNQSEKIEDLQRTQKLNDELTKAELRDASEVEKKQIRLNGLRREYSTLRKRGASGAELEANRNEQRSLLNEIKIGQFNAQRTLVNTLANVGSGLATGRAPAPRRRGRSERERIADRAQGNLLRAEDAVRTGQSPGFVASLTHSAAVDLAKVGGKVEQSTSKISREDAAASGSSLLSTNTILKEIRDNLKPVKTNAGGAK